MPVIAVAAVAVVLFAVSSLVACVGAAGAQPRGTASFSSAQDILRWINTYRLKPTPERLPGAVKAMSALALFRDLDSSGVYIGFMAGVLADNPDRADKLVSGMFPMPPEDQVAIVRAIAYSGLADWKGLLGRFAERMPARKVLIERHLEGKLPTLETVPLASNAAAMDALWGYFFATGRMAPVNRIVEALAWAKDGNDVEKLTTGSMAKWTLANKDLLDHLKAEKARRPKAIASQLDEIIEAAETYETSKIRKEAAAAIEELKRKGPDSTRKFTYWGMTGQTALALGCVVAGALGHVEIAVPCVIGGAASSAALRLLTPQ
jgi:hypothetical protein